VSHSIAKEECARESTRLIVLHHAMLQLVCSELIKTKALLNHLAKKLAQMWKTPFGYQSQVRQRRDLSTLSQFGGHAKAQKRLRELSKSGM